MANDENKYDLRKEAFRIAFDSMNREISLFWTRSSYFVLLSTAILAGLLFNLGKPIVAIPLTALGFWVSIVWFSVNIGSRFWVLRWEKKLRSTEKDLFGKGAKLYRITIQKQVEEVNKFLHSPDYQTGSCYQEKSEHFRERVNNHIRKKPSVTWLVLKISYYSRFVWVFLFLMSLYIGMEEILAWIFALVICKEIT